MIIVAFIVYDVQLFKVGHKRVLFNEKQGNKPNSSKKE